ncbi:N-acetyl-gamma-glutamyl-phosphate reductase [Flavihumibacter petaseus]|uniref:N-acetyl-gamma-glutamyl-phosphate reductase n=1 Tax=Flavihumibacter petaseus NBRC 106054 TaxID=1220578 RepID=A0A0E9N018_9BACT|nr:N-acetyl-gamma-glutamyl-phosphate reductase [Flavihumibacter petaseus]GAO43164.1 N-acetyl-gamma-glutamyl-phosphate reductase [Flavihumibacter petaseus NBRC 106054]
MIKVGIIGGAGYTGGELIRLLVHHPAAEITFVHSKSSAGKPLYSIHHDLLGETEQLFTGELSTDIDVLFLCTGHGEARKFLEANTFPAGVKIIDLSNDFRLQAGNSLGDLQFVYGLPELNRDRIAGTNGHAPAQAIANPGCFATAIQLGLLPLAHAGLLDEIYTTGITGSTGAGQSLAATSHFSWRANNIQAYKTLSHQHLGEIGESLQQLQSATVNAIPDKAIGLHFVPWRGDFTRGIFISSTLTLDRPIRDLVALYKEFYKGHPFTHVADDTIFLKQVVNTNKAVIHLEKAGTKLVVHSAIDNLLKGASGQAVQNMNLLFGVPETTGLQLKANYF